MSASSVNLSGVFAEVKRLAVSVLGVRRNTPEDNFQGQQANQFASGNGNLKVL